MAERAAASERRLARAQTRLDETGERLEQLARRVESAEESQTRGLASLQEGLLRLQTETRPVLLGEGFAVSKLKRELGEELLGSLRGTVLRSLEDRQHTTAQQLERVESRLEQVSFTTQAAMKAVFQQV